MTASSDAALRDLERTVSAAPGDGPARLALAHGLARAGQREAALRALDLRHVPDALMDGAQALARELWPAALAGLAPAWSIELPGPPLVGADGVVFSGDGRTLVVAGSWGADAAVSLVDVEGGELLHVERGVQTLRPHPTTSGALLEDRLQPRLLSLTRGPSRVERRARRLDDALGSIASVAPDGARVLLFQGGALHVCAWPGLRLLASVRGYSPGIDWARDLAITSAPVEEGLTVTPLSGEEPRTIALPVPWVATRTVIAPGVLCCAGNGLRLVHLERGWQTTLLRAARRGPLHAPSLASDRRALRLVLGARAVRIEVDLQAGRVLSSPPDLERLGKQGQDPVLIHPHADVWVDHAPRPERRALLRAFDGGARMLVLPPGVEPRAWSPDGLTLAVLVGERRLSIWRT